MPNSVKLANDIRLCVSELVEKLYQTDKTVELTKELGVQDVMQQLTRLSQEIVLSTVSDAIALEEFY